MAIIVSDATVAKLSNVMVEIYKQTEMLLFFQEGFITNHIRDISEYLGWTIPIEKHRFDISTLLYHWITAQDACQSSNGSSTLLSDEVLKNLTDIITSIVEACEEIVDSRNECKKIKHQDLITLEKTIMLKKNNILDSIDMANDILHECSGSFSPLTGYKMAKMIFGTEEIPG
jgi:hypothetical protein